MERVWSTYGYEPYQFVDHKISEMPQVQEPLWGRLRVRGSRYLYLNRTCEFKLRYG